MPDEPTVNEIEPQPFETEQILIVAEPLDDPVIVTVLPFTLSEAMPGLVLLEM